MKTLTTLLLAILLLSCNAQTKPAVKCWSDAQMDSASMLINFYKSYANQLLVQIGDRNATIDSLKNLPKAEPCPFDGDTLLVLMDTGYFRIFDKDLVVQVEKTGPKAKVSIIDTEGIRIYCTKIATDFDWWVQDSLFTRGSGHLDMR